MKTIYLFLIMAMALPVWGFAGCSDDDDSDDVDGGDDGGTDSDADSDSDSDADFECTEEDDWWIWDLSVMPPEDAQICAHVRAEGENVYALVEFDAWDESVDQTAVENLLAAWDESTAADSEAGIYEIVTGLFGDPPDVFDNDPKIYLFLYEMEGYMGTSFDGYFKVDDQIDSSNSNHHEMLHINALSHEPDSDYMLSIQAHEFQHLIHWGFDQDEESWLNESMSEVAMVATGFGADEAWVSSWLNDPQDPLLDNSPNGNYGIFMLFGTYLWEQFGDEFISDVVSDPANGVASLDSLLGQLATPTDFATVLGDFSLAVAINDTTVEGGEFGYELIDFIEPDSTVIGASGADVVVPASGGVAFLTADDAFGNNSLLLSTGTSTGLQVRVAMVSSSGSQVLDDDITSSSAQVDFGVLPSGSTMWVTAANPTSQDITLSAYFD